MVLTTVALSALVGSNSLHSWTFNIQWERAAAPFMWGDRKKHKWTSSSNPLQGFVLSKYYRSRGARPPLQGCLPLSRSCRHQFCPLGLSNQLGITGKVTLPTMWAEQPLPILEVHDEIAFHNFPYKNLVSIPWSQFCFLIDYIYVLDFLPEQIFWNCKANLSSHTRSLETSTTVQCSPWHPTVRRFCFISLMTAILSVLLKFLD